jgi:filamentous hemagglutinin family protein
MNQVVSWRRCLSVAAVIAGLNSQVRANPFGPSVAQGTASFTAAGPRLTIRTSDRAFINWQSFNIGIGETTSFVQPSSSSLVWNRINDPNPSQILGNLNANGYVVLQNQSGFFIGGQAVLTAHGLLLTTASAPMPDLTSQDPWSFNSLPPTASIINYGQLNLSQGGTAFLIAHAVENHGTISVPEGTVGLYAGKQVLVSERPDGRGLSAQVTLPTGSVDNRGNITADAGTIAMHAAVVNQGGLLQANSVIERNGVIELVASDAVHLGASSRIEAKGDSQGVSPGGSVLIKSDHAFSDQSTSSIQISGGTQGGEGGRAEISASVLEEVRTRVDGHALSGFRGGQLILDPVDLALTSAFVSSLTPILDGGLYRIDLQADHNITLETGWNLSDPGSSALLNLAAGNNITFANNSWLSAGNNWGLSLSAGPRNLSSAPPANSGGIYLQGNSYMETRNGNINLWAANDVIVNSDHVAYGIPFPNNNRNGIRTLAGGSITVRTDFGDVNSGASERIGTRIQYYANVNGFVFGQIAAPYYTVSPSLGGISTAAGGDVTISAGRDVISFAPIQTGNTEDYAGARFDGGSGAFGSLPGNVTVTAGRNVYGHFVLANGVGSINAGGNVGVPLRNGDGTSGDPTRGFALSLIDGSWAVSAPQGTIYVQDIRNPNGIFGERAGGNNNYEGYHVFNYSPFAAITLQAANRVEFTGQNAPHLPAQIFDRPIPFLLPPTLRVFAGADGFVLDQSITLFPSPYGELEITAGALTGQPNFNVRSTLAMADGGSTLWSGIRPVGSGYSSPQVELNNPRPVELNITGTIRDIDIITTKVTHLTVGADMIDAGFRGNNLHPSDVSSIHVTGRISNRPGLNFVALENPILSADPNRPDDWTSFFSWAVKPEVAAIDTRTLGQTVDQYIYSNRLFEGNPGFVYDASTVRLGFNGDMSLGLTPDKLQALTSPVTVVVLDSRGFPIVDPATGRIQTRNYTFVQTTPNQDPIASLLQVSQGAPPNPRANSGYAVGGPGRFDINAGSMDLGNTLGAQTTGGAALNVTLAGNLTMLTSRIVTIAGGDLTVNSVGGTLDLGTQDFFIPNDGDAYGIYTTGLSDVRVIAHGDVNINGSRIAAYNGGDVYVESSYGNVNVGSGGNAYVNVPLVGGAYSSAQVYGSGIVAVSLPAAYRPAGGAMLPGDITVTTPRGDIISSLAGILQVALDGNVSAGPRITLSAGTPASDGSPAIPGNIYLGSSGLIGGSVSVTAEGNIQGLIISRQNSVITAAQSFSGTLLSAGSASVSAAGTISGTVIGVGGASVSGNISGANVLGQNVSVNGGVAQSTLGSTATASTTSQAAAQASNSDTKQQLVKETTGEEEDDTKRKKPVVVERRGRVTVILPKA